MTENNKRELKVWGLFLLGIILFQFPRIYVQHHYFPNMPLHSVWQWIPSAIFGAVWMFTCLLIFPRPNNY
jgi:hypothetical protein